MRRLVALVSVLVFADTLMFSAIIPLIPVYADDFHLSKLEAGVLVGAYGAGAMIAGIPAGLLAARIGAKRTAALGLVALAVSTTAFAFASSAAALEVARLTQGMASAITWSGALAWLTLGTPRARRGQVLGTAFGFAVLGFIVGPGVGAVAGLTSIRVTFVALGLAAGLLAIVATAFPESRSESLGPDSLRRALRDVGFLAAVWLTLVPALFFGLLDVLVPLSLDAAGWGTVSIAAAFVGAGLVEVALAPVIGGVSDRRGRLYPIRAALGLLAAVALALAVVTAPVPIVLLVIGASLAASGIYTPGIALVSDRAEANGMPQTLAFGVMNTAWAAGAMTGPAAGGALADAIGNPAPYLVCACIAVATLFVVGRTRPAPCRPA